MNSSISLLTQSRPRPDFRIVRFPGQMHVGDLTTVITVEVEGEVKIVEAIWE